MLRLVVTTWVDRNASASATDPARPSPSPATWATNPSTIISRSLVTTPTDAVRAAPSWGASTIDPTTTAGEFSRRPDVATTIASIVIA
jgi:hypothetical protein